MNKLIKNKTLLFYIFCFNPTVIFAESKAVESTQKDDESKDGGNSELEKENELLQLQMQNKFLKLELQKKQKEAEEWETKNKENEEFKSVDQQIKKMQKEIELLQNKHALLLAQQCDNEDFREQSKKNLEISNRKNNLEAEIELARKELELKNIERARMQVVEENKVEYLDEPLLKNGTLVLSDRQIQLDSAISSQTAEKIEHDIDFFNNKNDKQPIFLIIDRCSGGHVEAGCRILDKMNNSKAPVYVVVKSFAASMAAIITTLAKRSFILKNAIILHHQPSQTYFLETMNLKEHEEALKNIKEVWERIEGPVAKKMGITLEAFMKKMYEKNSRGEWMEYGDNAKKIHWVDNVITNIRDTSVKTKFDDKNTKKKKSHKEDLHNFVQEQNDFFANDFCYMYIPENFNLKLTYHK